MKSIGPDELRRLILYDPETGLLTWKERSEDGFTASGSISADARAKQWNSRHAGNPAVSCDKGDGRLTGPVWGVMHLAHRVAWAVHYGSWPTDEIDHINGDASDNRISNLREVDRRENSINAPRRKDNKSGVTGVCFHNNRWMARIGSKHIGCFMEKSDAVAARKRMEAELGYHENHGRA